MTAKDLKTLAKYVAEELVRLAKEQKVEEEEFIFIDEISRLTGLSKQSLYNMHAAKSESTIPIIKRNNKLCSTRTSILEWMREQR